MVGDTIFSSRRPAAANASAAVSSAGGVTRVSAGTETAWPPIRTLICTGSVHVARPSALMTGERPSYAGDDEARGASELLVNVSIGDFGLRMLSRSARAAALRPDAAFRLATIW